LDCKEWDEAKEPKRLVVQTSPLFKLFWMWIIDRRRYLPMRRQIRNLYSRLNSETIPGPVITEIERAKKAPRLFDRVEIWSRAGDPMAVGVIGEENPRYFSIACWGDAELTLEVKEKLQLEKCLLRLTSTGGILVFLVTMFATVTYGWITVGF